jgi:imidazolonepropionase-like amidohydrolase
VIEAYRLLSNDHMTSRTPKSVVLFQNVRVFDGVHRGTTGSDVRIEDNLIATISRHDGGARPEPGTQVIAGGGRVLMPGLIDAHWHALLCSISPMEALAADVSYLHLVAAGEARRTLMRGFTTVRDVGGPAFGLKRIIDENKLEGPRIFPSGAIISQTSGHADFRQRPLLPSHPRQDLCQTDAAGVTAIADGVPAVLRVVREQLLLGATQIKLCAGGGVASEHDPIDVTQYTEAELRAAVDAATDWGTYVTVHAYTPRSIARSLRAGVRCIEHGHLMDDATAALIADKGAWVCMQPFLDDEDAIPVMPAQRAKQMLILDGTDTTYRLARKHGFKLAFGTDTLFNAALLDRQGAQLVKLARWFDNHEVLQMATSVNGELLAMCGDRNPYPGKLGVVAPGALADLLLVDGDPVANLALIADPAKNFVIIMKDGVIYKNLLS